VRCMHIYSRSIAAAGLAAVLIVAGQTAASATRRTGSSGSWSQVTPNGTSTTADVGLARGSDGILHVVWETGATGQEKIMDTPIAAGGTVDSAVTIASHLQLATDPDATVTPTGLDAFWNGITNDKPDSPTGTFEATRPLSGGHWSLGANIKPLPTLPYTSSSDSAGTGSDGKPWVAFTGTDSLVAVHVGHPEVRLPPEKCCVVEPGFGTDGSTGTTWLAYMSSISGQAGVYAQHLSQTNASGTALLLPGSRVNGDVVQASQRIGITGRGSGRAGVYAVYGSPEPSATAVDLVEVGTSTPTVLASIPSDEALGGDTVTAGPSGQLWAAWFYGEGTPLGLFVRMSNDSASSFGKTTKVPLPSGTTELLKVYINAQASKLDVLALLTVNGNTAYWSTQVLPPS
jgi:hypothetical protein